MGALLRPAIVVGTRPEAIKMAPLVAELGRSPWANPMVISTGQHRELLDQALDLFPLSPSFDLSIMTPNQSLSEAGERALAGLDKLLGELRPDIVLVEGDTTSAFVAALAAFYRRIPVGHVEAGLRTFDKDNPYPEEAHRRMIAALATLHFAPTRTNRRNLLREGIKPTAIFVTGNTVVDALLTIIPRLGGTTKSEPSPPKRLILVTAHRRESWGEPLRGICAALKELVSLFPDVEVVYPVHPNPNVHSTVYALLAGNPRVHLVGPLSYLAFVELMQQAYLILTDSGGVQEEAPVLKKPVLVMREATDRPEGVRAGTAKVVGTRRDDIVREASLLLQDGQHYQKMAQAPNPYGDGRAAERIVGALRYFFGLTPHRPSEFVGLACVPFANGEA